MAVISKRHELKKEDLVRWGRNALIFAGPALLVLIASAVELIPVDAGWGVVALYLINVGTDLLRKFMRENSY